jgi:hypothetical protein
MLDLGLTPDLIDAEDDGRYGLAGGDSRGSPRDAEMPLK